MLLQLPVRSFAWFWHGKLFRAARAGQRRTYWALVELEGDGSVQQSDWRAGGVRRAWFPRCRHGLKSIFAPAVLILFVRPVSNGLQVQPIEGVA